MPDPQGRVGRAYCWPENMPPSITSVDVCILTVNNEIILPEYIEFYLNHPLTLALTSKLLGGTSHPRLRKIDIESLVVIYPDLSTQRKIILQGRKLIELEKEVLAKSESLCIEIISSLFRSWFIDFDPVKAKSEGRLPYGMDEETLALFSDSFQETEIGTIPDGWTVKKIGDIAGLTKGLSYKGAYLEETNDKGKKMMNLGCFGIDGSFRRNKIKYYSGDYKERHLLEGGDLLIANTDMTQDRVILGSCIIIPSGYEGAIFTHHTTRLRVHKNLDPRLNSFIAYQLSQITFRHIAQGYSTGSTVLALPIDAILNYKIALPPKELLDKFLTIEGDFFSRSQVLFSTQEYLRNTRDALLPSLMSGELEV